MTHRRIIILAASATLVGTSAAALAGSGEQDMRRPASSAKASPGSDGVVDLMVTGPAARTLYDRLPGEGKEEKSCGALGLHKGDGSMTCTKHEGNYSCHIWLDVPKQTLAPAESDDC